MDEWSVFTKHAPFKHKWLLKYKTSYKKAMGKKVHIKPYLVPDPNFSSPSFCQKFEYFFLNFNYPNYSFVEFDKHI